MRQAPIVLCILLTTAAFAIVPTGTAAPGDITDGTNTVCLVVLSTPVGNEDYQCTRGTISGSVTACRYEGFVWGCDIEGTASSAQDPATCGYTWVASSTKKATSNGCGAPNTDIVIGGAPILAPPVPMTADFGWIEAELVNGVWQARLHAEVEVHEYGTPSQARNSEAWDVFIEVPPPSDPTGCPASASVAAGIHTTGLRILAPDADLAVEYYVSPVQLLLGDTQSTQAGGGADAQFYADTGDAGC